MICALDVWSLDQGRGAPTLHRTLEAYGSAGHRVTLVGPDIGANHLYRPGLRPWPEQRPAIPNVRYETFHMPSLKDLPFPIPAALDRIEQKARFAALFPVLAARRAISCLEREAYDVLYAYEVHGALATRLVQRRFRLPTVARFQGTVMRPALDDPFLRARRYEEVLALRIPADLYIMTDDGTQGDEVLARLNPASRGKVRFWRNGVDLERLRPPSPQERREARAALGLPDDAFVMLTASRLAAWKRVDRAIRALPAVRAWTPGATLLVVGDGEERPTLEALADRLAVRDAVRFEGAVRQEEVVRYMWAADLFLALADLSNVGNPLLEAMATGMCVLTVDAGDTRELIRDGETGRLLDSPQRSGVAEPFERRLADAIVALAGDAALRERLGRGARAYAEERFWTWEQRLAAEIAEVERVAGVAKP